MQQDINYEFDKQGFIEPQNLDEYLKKYNLTYEELKAELENKKIYKEWMKARADFWYEILITDQEMLDKIGTLMDKFLVPGSIAHSSKTPGYPKLSIEKYLKNIGYVEKHKHKKETVISALKLSMDPGEFEKIIEYQNASNELAAKKKVIDEKAKPLIDKLKKVFESLNVKEVRLSEGFKLKDMILKKEIAYSSIRKQIVIDTIGEANFLRQFPDKMDKISYQRIGVKNVDKKKKEEDKDSVRVRKRKGKKK